MKKSREEGIKFLRPQVDPKTFAEVLFMSWTAETPNGNYVPVMVVGHPGTGKTSMVRSMANHFDLGYYQMLAMGTTVENLIGMAVPDTTSQSINYIPIKSLRSFLMGYPEGVIALDDFFLSSPDVVGRFFEVIANGEWMNGLTQKMKFVVKTNFVEQARPNTSLAAINNRFVIVELNPFASALASPEDSPIISPLLELAKRGADDKTFLDTTYFYSQQTIKQFSENSLRRDPIPSWRNLDGKTRLNALIMLEKMYKKAGGITDEMAELLLRVELEHQAQKRGLVHGVAEPATSQNTAVTPESVKARLSDYLDYKSAFAKAAGIFATYFEDIGHQQIEDILKKGLSETEYDFVPYYSQRATEMAIALAASYLYAREKGIALGLPALHAAITGTIGHAFSPLVSEIHAGGSLPSINDILEGKASIPSTYGGRAIILSGLASAIGAGFVKYLTAGDVEAGRRGLKASEILLKEGGVDETLITTKISEVLIGEYRLDQLVSEYKSGQHGEDAKYRALKLENAIRGITALATEKAINKESEVQNFLGEVNRLFKTIEGEKKKNGLEPDL